MVTSPVNSLVRELETTLALVKNLMQELRETRSDATTNPRVAELLAALQGRSELDELPNMLLNAYAEITTALGGIRVSRETIQTQAIDQLRATNEKLAEVSSHTEAAATRMLDGLDRTLVLIDQLSDAQSDGNLSLQESAETLRGEINELFNCLQFQDITAQQLRGAVDLLGDVEDRLEGVANLFDGGEALADLTGKNDVADEPAATYDPEASMNSALSRQQLADEMLRNARGHTEKDSDPVENCAGLPQ